MLVLPDLFLGKVSRWKIVTTAASIRILVTVLMAFVAYILPCWYPGSDVSQFILPEIASRPVSSVVTAQSHSLSLRFEECNATLKLSFPGPLDDCGMVTECSYKWIESGWWTTFVQTSVYPVLFRPLTRWDSARFLSKSLGKCCVGSCLPVDASQEFLEEVEQSHAFLPLFPLLVRWTARFLLLMLPRTWLPASCAGLAVLSATLMNLVFFCNASIEIFLMTERVITYEIQKRSFRQLSAPASAQIRNIAATTCTLFILNPANVFFSAAYSEALAAALTFFGCHWGIRMLHALDTKASFSVYWAKCLVMTTIPWSLAALTRSNSLAYAGFLLLYALGICSRFLSSSEPKLWLALPVFCCASAILCLLTLYNARTIHHLCTLDNDLTMKPTWCNEGRLFNLYTYVQQKHWNVGFLKYYEAKQVPNFLLAAPILLISVAAVFEWIAKSFQEYRGNFTKMTPLVGHVWATQALSKQAGYGGLHTDSKYKSELLLSPLLLGFYAVLAAMVLLVVTVAHIQIATRIICSSCPALYWFMALKVEEGSYLGKAIPYYIFLYITLGIIMHSLWLPWT